MRSISVSTDVFAKIWSIREPAEHTEDAVLRRVLGCGSTVDSTTKPANGANEDGGFYAKRYDVRFADGFEIFRTFKGSDYRAKATHGAWLLLSSGERYQSLSDLSRAVGAKIENVWMNWFYSDNAGQRRPIADKRDQSKVSRRSRIGVR
jgi:hypothetical protein